MKHTKGDCNNADPNSDENCPVCCCEDEECIREKGHKGFHCSKEDLPNPKEHNPFNLNEPSNGNFKSASSYPKELPEWEELKQSLKLTVKENEGVLDLRNIKEAQKTFDAIIELQWNCLKPKIQSLLSQALTNERGRIEKEIRFMIEKEENYSGITMKVKDFLTAIKAKMESIIRNPLK